MLLFFNFLTDWGDILAQASQGKSVIFIVHQFLSILSIFIAH